jgi:two-component system, LuxR family, response regulator FixJ
MMADATVIVVDDDPGAIKSMRWLLESDGLPVTAFSSGEEFLKAYDPNRPGCLLLDLQMPGMDGLELQRRLASMGDHPPIIFVTGHGNVARCAEAMKAGALDFLEKPVDDSKVLEVVRLGIEEDHRRRSIEATHSEIAARVAQLTQREREIVHFLREGNAMKAIASRLGIGIQTVAKHRAGALHKMQVRNDAELVRLLEGYPL